MMQNCNLSRSAVGCPVPWGIPGAAQGTELPLIEGPMLPTGRSGEPLEAPSSCLLITSPKVRQHNGVHFIMLEDTQRTETNAAPRLMKSVSRFSLHTARFDAKRTLKMAPFDGPTIRISMCQSKRVVVFNPKQARRVRR